MQSIPPVPCPNCGESQNVFQGSFSPDQEPFNGVSCMVCGHVFEQDEYRTLLAQARSRELGPMPG